MSDETNAPTEPSELDALKQQVAALTQERDAALAQVAAVQGEFAALEGRIKGERIQALFAAAGKPYSEEADAPLRALSLASIDGLFALLPAPPEAPPAKLPPAFFAAGQPAPEPDAKPIDLHAIYAARRGEGN